jgi:hypothetical protein
MKQKICTTFNHPFISLATHTKKKKTKSSDFDDKFLVGSQEFFFPTFISSV